MNCETCNEYKNGKKHITRFGDYPSECKLLKIGRNPDSEACNKYNGGNGELIVIEDLSRRDSGSFE